MALAHGHIGTRGPGPGGSKGTATPHLCFDILRIGWFFRLDQKSIRTFLYYAPPLIYSIMVPFITHLPDIDDASVRLAVGNLARIGRIGQHGQGPEDQRYRK